MYRAALAFPGLGARAAPLLRLRLADVVMTEEDGSTSHRSFAKDLTSAPLTIVGTGAYAPLANAVLDAMPGDWGPAVPITWTPGTPSSGTTRARSKARGATAP
ncbi:hypothetical protein GCM10010420_12100 [Streptomyces glaucosporus]|uniref:Uncharacterized protein n=1 Tax=Streptomyces glaucosporus TaxID=284044 RepID=A0ABN3HYV1_9ACTN